MSILSFLKIPQPISEAITGHRWIKYVLWLIIISIPLFMSLTVLTIQLWDESLQGVNAYEMLKNGNWIVTYSEGQPDMWNTKPPLMIWCIVIMMKLFGTGLFALRFPSALAGLFTCVLLLILSRRYMKTFWYGFIASLVLITCNGYVHLHGTRTGDYDALLTLFTTSYAICFFLFVETGKNKFLLFTFFFVILACFTKGIGGLLFLPALLIYAAIRRVLVSIFKNKYFYWGLLLFFLFVAGYYLLRENMTPGYLKAVWDCEIGGRYTSVIEGHTGTRWFYYQNFIAGRLQYWYLLVPCGILTGIFSANILLKRITIYSTILCFTFILILSFGESKQHTYDIPSYPFLALLVGIFIYHIFSLIRSKVNVSNIMTYNVLPYLLLFLIFIIPYSAIIKKTYKPEEKWQNEIYNPIIFFLKDALKNKPDVDGFHLVTNDVKYHTLFYVYMLNEQNKKIDYKDISALQPNDKIIAYQKNTKEYIEQNYDYTEIYLADRINGYKIIKKKNSSD